MALREYLWHGRTYQIADEDLPRYPGAVPVEQLRAEEVAKGAGRKAPTPKAAHEPENKADKPAQNKRARKKAVK